MIVSKASSTGTSNNFFFGRFTKTTFRVDALIVGRIAAYHVSPFFIILEKLHIQAFISYTAVLACSVGFACFAVAAFEGGLRHYYSIEAGALEMHIDLANVALDHVHAALRRTACEGSK